MINIFAQHRAKIAANTAKITQTDEVKTSGASKKDNIPIALQQLFTLVLDDVRRLKDTARDKRDALKMQFINKYYDTFNEQYQELSWTGNIFIFWNIMWRFDIGNFNDGWVLAKLGFERGLTADEQVFKRSFSTIVADTIYEWAQEAYDNGQVPSPILQELIAMVEEDGGLIINEVIHAKLLKLQATIITDNNPELALAYFNKATKLFPKIGVKGRIDKVTNQLKDEPPAGEQDGDDDDEPPVEPIDK